MRHKKPVDAFMAEQTQGGEDYAREYMGVYRKEHHQRYNEYQREYKRNQSRVVKKRPALPDPFFDNLRLRLH